MNARGVEMSCDECEGNTMRQCQVSSVVCVYIVIVVVMGNAASGGGPAGGTGNSGTAGLNSVTVTAPHHRERSKSTSIDIVSATPPSPGTTNYAITITITILTSLVPTVSVQSIIAYRINQWDATGPQHYIFLLFLNGLMRSTLLFFSR